MARNGKTASEWLEENATKDDPAPPDHNAKSRAATIRETIGQISDLIEARNTISAEISEIKNKRIKGDLGMKVSDFNVALRVYRLEGDDRATLFDTLRETFEALGIGEQASFLDALGDAA